MNKQTNLCENCGSKTANPMPQQGYVPAQAVPGAYWIATTDWEWTATADWEEIDKAYYSPSTRVFLIYTKSGRVFIK